MKTLRVLFPLTVTECRQHLEDRLTVLDGNRDGNRGELWRTPANVGEQRRAMPIRGELWRTMTNVGGRSQEALKTARAQALGGSNPSPSATV